MPLNRKLTGALAWGGLFVIFAVPSAELVTSQLAPRALEIVPAALPDGVTPLIAAPEPATRVASTNAADALHEYLDTGKPLPSYISDAPAAVTTTAPKPVVTAPLAVNTPTAPTPKPTTPATPATQPAATQTAVVAPVPMPAHMRPLPPAQTPTVQPSTATVATVPTEPVVIVDESVIDEPVQEASLPRQEPRVVPPADVDGPVVTSDELADWNSGSLADYLSSRGLISDEEQQATVDDSYDEDGFFLSDGPNNDRRSRARRVRDNDGFPVFPNFN